MDALIINGYAGSLTLGARAARIHVRGAYEDKGYGIDIQRANFRGFPFIDDAAAWPKQSLARTIVAAHPPCAPFSIQNARNRNPKIRGTTSDNFKCTTRIMTYALSQRAAALAIESVVGTLEGARSIHDDYAERYGYARFRVIQNAASFGVPQWRKRFWIIFVRRDLTRGRPFTFYHRPTWRRLRDVLDVGRSGLSPYYMNLYVHKQLRHIRAAGVPQRTINRIIAEPCKGIVLALKKHVRALHDLDDLTVAREFVGGTYYSSHIRVLDPDDVAPTLMAGYNWMVNGRIVSQRECKRVMGYPEDYVFPAPYYENRLMEFLSRGVCPPVARWILEQTLTYLGERQPSPRQAWVQDVKDGETVDFAIKRNELFSKSLALPRATQLELNLG